jgi:hypothetical protein
MARYDQEQWARHRDSSSATRDATEMTNADLRGRRCDGDCRARSSHRRAIVPAGHDDRDADAVPAVRRHSGRHARGQDPRGAHLGARRTRIHQIANLSASVHTRKVGLLHASCQRGRKNSGRPSRQSDG